MFVNNKHGYLGFRVVNQLTVNTNEWRYALTGAFFRSWRKLWLDSQ